MDCIGLVVSDGLSGSHRLDSIGWILSVLVLGLLGKTCFYALGGLLLAGWDGWTGWDVGGMEVPALAGAGTGAPPLDLQERKAVGSGGWNQLRRCCKGAKYFCQSGKIVQIDCTKIRTNT